MFAVLAWLLYATAMVSTTCFIYSGPYDSPSENVLPLFTFLMYGTALFVGIVQSMSRPRPLFLVLFAIAVGLFALYACFYALEMETWLYFLVFPLAGLWMLIQHVLDAERSVRTIRAKGRCRACGCSLEADEITHDAGGGYCKSCAAKPPVYAKSGRLAGSVAEVRYGFADPFGGKSIKPIRYAAAAMAGLVAFFLFRAASLPIMLLGGWVGLIVTQLLAGGVSGFVSAGFIRPATRRQATLAGLVGPALDLLFTLKDWIVPILASTFALNWEFLPFMAIPFVGAATGGWLCYRGQVS